MYSAFYSAFYERTHHKALELPATHTLYTR